MGFTKLAQIPLRYAEQRAQMPTVAEGSTHRHGRQAGKSGAAQQLQQQRLRLILRMMRGQQAFARSQVAGEAQVTRVARRRLDRHAAAGVDGHRNDAERDAEPRAKRGAGLAQSGRGRLQPMIDVHRANRQAARGVRPSPRRRAANCAIAANKHAESAPPLTATTSPVAAAGTCSSSTACSNAALKLMRSSTVAEHTESAQAGLAGIQQLSLPADYKVPPNA